MSIASRGVSRAVQRSSRGQADATTATDGWNCRTAFAHWSTVHGSARGSSGGPSLAWKARATPHSSSARSGRKGRSPVSTSCAEERGHLRAGVVEIVGGQRHRQRRSGARARRRPARRPSGRGPGRSRPVNRERARGSRPCTHAAARRRVPAPARAATRPAAAVDSTRSVDADPRIRAAIHSLDVSERGMIGMRTAHAEPPLQSAADASRRARLASACTRSNGGMSASHSTSVAPAPKRATA